MKGRKSSVTFHRPVVWVTGASRGIGKEIAKQFAFIGCEVALSARSLSELKKVEKEIQRYGGRAYSFPCDVSETEEILKTAKAINRTFGPVDVLVNNAGITVFKSFLDTTLEEFDDILDTNLEGHIACIKSVLPSMVKRKRGWIINILSNAAVKTFEGSAAYTAAKAGMLGLSRVLREEMRKYNVKVVNVIPGPVETKMWSAKDRKKFSRRMMSPKSVAEAVLAIYQMPVDVVVDEIRIRPMKGDIE
jgi:short-subunit dehydrogenase